MDTLKAAVGLCAALWLGGCATLVKGSDQDVQVTTEPVQGAECTLQSSAIGSRKVTTPATVNLPKSKHSILVSCEKEGYEKSTATITSHFEGWTLGNLLLGGVVGFGVDAASGALNKYDKKIVIPLKAVSSPPATSQPTPKKGKQTSALDEPLAG